MNRRQFLARSAAVATVGLAGCLGDNGDDTTQGDDEETDGTTPDETEEAFVTVWRTDNEGETADDQIRLPLLEAGTYDFEVDWGDGTSDTIEQYNDAAVTHTYDDPGEYEVTIDGTLEGWSFIDDVELRGTTDEAKLLEIREWGKFDASIGESREWSEGDPLPTPRADFAGARNLIVTAADSPAMQSGTSAFMLFSGTDLTEASGLSEWDVSNVKDMGWMFNAESFDGDVSEWDVSNVENMEGMFAFAAFFDGDVSRWDVSNVIDMGLMFAYAESFDGDVSEWDVSNVENMARMFEDAKSFDGDVSEWDVSNVENMERMFFGAESFDGDVSGWDVSNVKDMVGMFFGAESFDGDVSEWDVSNVEDMEGMFAGTESFDGDVSGWDVSNVEEMQSLFWGAKSFDGDVSEWDVSNVEEMHRMFFGAKSFDGDVSGWDVSNVERMNEMFASAESFDGDVSEWDVSSVTNMRGMFQNAPSFDGDVSGWDVSNVQVMHRMFEGSGLSTENYDALLVEWQHLDLEADVRLSAGETQYSPGEPAEARQHIIDEYGWNITDGGLAE